MSNYISSSIINLFELFTSHTHRQSVVNGRVDAAQMVEHVVDVVDPKIRVIGRYAQKLGAVVERTWGYLNEVANTIPGGVALSRSGFSSDPRMRLIFESQGVIQQLLASVVPLIESHGSEKSQTSSQIYMLLCMDRKEHNFLGAELAGDILKREVLQTKVVFGNRKFLSAGYNEDDARLGFKQCAFEGLLHKVHDLILDSRKEHRQLIEKKRQLHQQLHASHESHYRQHSSIFFRNDYLVDAPPELQEIERKLTEIRMKSESPDQHLLQTIDVLSHPEQYLKVEVHSLVLNNLGIKLPPGSSEGAITIDYAEVEIEQSLKRTTILVNSPVEEIFPLAVH